MRKLFVIVTACTLGGWGIGGALGGCGGDDGATVGATTDDGGSNGTSGGTSGGSSGTSGGTTSGGPSDGGSDDAGADGGSSSGSASNPGRITCGASECNVANQICCRSVLDAGCIPDDANCPGAGLEMECDEEADCPQGQTCCLGASQGGRARCRNSCGGSEVRLCKTNAECGDAGACNEKTCLGRSFQVCGDPNVRICD